ncbi:MAG: iron chelate uptake ABC transporter family permease subunit [Candidatus Bathyarchaeota archaeon]|nr:iron chelate uptake ABC transporter family permease subunit [Candidatus Bathyarchaeota archaeon]
MDTPSNPHTTQDPNTSDCHCRQRRLSTSRLDLHDIELMIIKEIRLPRVLAGALIGSGLALAGTVFQGVFRNPMADPYVLGVSSGAALGAALAIVMRLGYSAVGVYSVSILSFLIATLTVFAVYGLAKVGSRAPVITLLLSGVAVSIFLSSLVSLLQVFSGWELHRLIYWMMGGFSYIEWADVLGVFPLITIGTLVTYLFSRDLNIMTLGDEEAQHLGVNVERSRKILLAVGSLMTAAAVSVSGLIGFVGLVIPHLTRMLVGPDHRVLIPSSFLTGGIFLVFCDTLARSISGSTELPVGIITALSGGPFFIYLLRKSRGRYAI